MARADDLTLLHRLAIVVIVILASMVYVATNNVIQTAIFAVVLWFCLTAYIDFVY